MNIYQLFPLLIAFLFTNQFVWAQSCLPNGISFSQQVDIDNFPNNYPGCTEIEGDLRINAGFFGSIENLAGLSQIKIIGGSLTISEISKLRDLTDLANLESIGGDLEVSYIDSLRNLNGLEQIQSVPGKLTIRNNPSLQDLTGLNNVNFVNDNFWIMNNHALITLNGLNNLDSIGGHFWILTSENLENMMGLEKLRHVNRDIKIGSIIHLKTLNGLENLHYVGEDFEITENYFLQSLSGLNNLKEVGGYLDISENPSQVTLAGLDQLQSTGSKLKVSYCPELKNFKGLEQLVSVGGHLEVHNNPKLENLEGLDQLQSIGKSLWLKINISLKNITNLSSLEYIGLDIDIINNDSLLSLAGLENLSYLGEDIILNNNHQLRELADFSQLTTIRGSLECHGNDSLRTLAGLSQVRYIGKDLELIFNNALPNFTGLDKVQTIGRNLDIPSNKMLNSLTGLEQVSFVGGFLRITNDNALSSLEGLGNIDYTHLTDLQIWGNDSLSVCEHPTVCDYLTDEANQGLSTIHSNAPGCDSILEVLAFCGELSKVNYQIFYDVNQNKIRDTGELIHPDALLGLAPDATLHFPNTQKGGLLFLDKGDYELSYYEAATPLWNLTTDSASFALSIGDFITCDTFFFGLYPSLDTSDLTTIINTPRARCNEIIPLEVHTKNTGTSITEGTLWLTLDDEVDSIVWIDSPDTILSPLTYGWYFQDLFPGHSSTRKIRIEVPGPPDFFVGKRISFSSYAEYQDLNGTYLSDTIPHDAIVRCSYDPNDKLVFPNRASDFTLFEEDLTYTIRFQNTGNDVAYDVVVRDTLDPNLDPRTFTILSSSHPEILQTSLTENRYLNFTFKDIFLPDSTSNLEGSQGYVSFRISPYDGLDENTIINNTASIYFDLNPPIVTNTTQNIMVSEIISSLRPVADMGISLFPNPTTGIVNIQSSENFTGQVRVADYTGQLVLQKTIKGNTALDLRQQCSGIYFITIQTEKGNFTSKLVKF